MARGDQRGIAGYPLCDRGDGVTDCVPCGDGCVRDAWAGQPQAAVGSHGRQTLARECDHSGQTTTPETWGASFAVGHVPNWRRDKPAAESDAAPAPTALSQCP